MSLNRVPPNLLVGEGATDFAYEYGMPTLPADILVSSGARDRWLRWRRELDHVEGRGQSYTDAMDIEGQDSTHDSSSEGPLSPGRREMSPDGPQATVVAEDRQNPAKSNGSSTQNSEVEPDPTNGELLVNGNCAQRYANGGSDITEQGPAQLGSVDETFHHIADVQFPTCIAGAAPNGDPSPIALPGPVSGEASNGEKIYDEINDTVGAIAIDWNGNIAAGSSSGGIGMKHCGRTGPAALVGIGTAVIPVDPDDEMQTSAAAVASGTGEHMATTMAAGTCAERIYSSIRKVKGEPGVFESVTEDEAMEAMVTKDFMSMGIRVAFPLIPAFIRADTLLQVTQQSIPVLAMLP